MSGIVPAIQVFPQEEDADLRLLYLLEAELHVLEALLHGLGIVKG